METISPGGAGGERIFFSRNCAKYRFMSQSYKTNVLIDGTTYVSVEDYMQKTKLKHPPGDQVEELEKEIGELAVTGGSGPDIKGRRKRRRRKRRETKSFLRRRRVMVSKAVRAKFQQSGEMRQLLLQTGERELIYAHVTDSYWGVGLGATEAAHNEHKWGANRLGLLLSEIRKELREMERRYVRTTKLIGRRDGGG